VTWLQVRGGGIQGHFGGEMERQRIMLVEGVMYSGGGEGLPNVRWMPVLGTVIVLL
jgi:hypothetical protein